MSKVSALKIKTSLITMLVFLFSVSAFAKLGSAHALFRSTEDYQYDHYFSVSNSNVADNKVHAAELLKFESHQAHLPLPAIKYDRVSHFGTWKDNPNDDTCMNTRSIVLTRDSVKKVEMGGSRGCTVIKGQWTDPYTALQFKLSLDIEIDHLVPLKHAYMTGAYEWTPEKRCLYANYIGNRFHLVSASKMANQEKSDKSPAEWMPDNQAFTCQYLVNWLKTKYIWNLRVLPTEAEAIQALVAENSCNTADFVMTQAEIATQQRYMTANAHLCTP